MIKNIINKRDWSIRVVMKYALLQVPALVLVALALILAQQWIYIPSWIIWGIIVLWIAKDIILFPLVWRSYDQQHPADKEPMVGKRGIARDHLDPSGYVRVRGELWRAEVLNGDPAIEKGAAIQVLGIRGLTLIVQLDKEGSAK